MGDPSRAREPKRRAPAPSPAVVATFSRISGAAAESACVRSFATGELPRGDDGGWFVIEGARRGSRGGRATGRRRPSSGAYFGRAPPRRTCPSGDGGVGGVGGSAEARRDGERAADVAGARVWRARRRDAGGRSTSSGRSVGADAPARPAGSSSSSGFGSSPSSGASAVMRASSASRASSSMSSPSSAMRRASARIAACAREFGGGGGGRRGGKRATRVPSGSVVRARGILGAHPAASRHRAPGRSERQRVAARRMRARPRRTRENAIPVDVRAVRVRYEPALRSCALFVDVPVPSSRGDETRNETRAAKKCSRRRDRIPHSSDPSAGRGCHSERHLRHVSAYRGASLRTPPPRTPTMATTLIGPRGRLRPRPARVHAPRPRARAARARARPPAFRSAARSIAAAAALVIAA